MGAIVPAELFPLPGGAAYRREDVSRDPKDPEQLAALSDGDMYRSGESGADEEDEVALQSHFVSVVRARQGLV